MGATRYRDCPLCGCDELREDYEIIGDGYTITVDYQCNCKRCCYSDNFKYSYDSKKNWIVENIMGEKLRKLNEMDC